jgi:hypothetical protein
MDGGEVVSLTRRPPSISWKIPQGWVNSRAIVWLEGLGNFKKEINFVGNRNRNFPASSIAPGSITLKHAPRFLNISICNNISSI